MSTLFRRWIRRRPEQRGFSLIEILIAVIILGLGLLGLAALFPVVIREQRIGADNVLGVIVGNSAKAILSHTNFNSGLPKVGGTPAYEGSCWKALKYSKGNNGPYNFGLSNGAIGSSPDEYAGTGQKYELGEWTVPTVLSAPDSRFSLSTTIIGDPQNEQDQIGIPLSMRLYPSAVEGTRTLPQMVWDIAVQRISDFDYSTGPIYDRLRAAIFVRRIDSRIRTSESVRLRDALLAPNIAMTDKRIPVAEDGDEVPTYDGIGIGTSQLNYSQLKTITYGDVGFPTIVLGGSALKVNTTTNPRAALIAQPGQILVDNLGNIYTVTRIETRLEDETAQPGEVFCVLSPPISPHDFEPTDPPLPPLPQKIQQFLFSAQVPASVILTEIDE